MLAVTATMVQLSCTESFALLSPLPAITASTATTTPWTGSTTTTRHSSLHMVFTQSEPSTSIQERFFETVPKLGVLAGAVATATALSTNDLHFQFQELTSDPIAQSLVAAAFGVASVSAATAFVDHFVSSSDSVPVYDSRSERFDQSTFMGRYCKMLFMCDPRLLLYSEEEVRNYQVIAYGGEDYTNYYEYNTADDDNSKTPDDRSRWEAKRIADSALNKETNEWIPRPFRMSGYLPFNGPICIALVGASSTMPLLFWSWLNQSQNALVNFYNRNASSKVTHESLLTSYAIAVGSALLVAFSLSQYVQTNFAGEEASQLLRLVSFPSAVVASSLNCFFVRSPELESGVPLLNDRFENVLVGETSLEAAKKGVYSTTASRAILQMPTFFIPPLLLGTVEPLKQLLMDNPSLGLPVTTYLLLVVFGVGLPAAVGFFPQMSKLDAADVEPKYQDLVDPLTNAPYTHFTFNKGL